jgi:HSP20 family protein
MDVLRWNPFDDLKTIQDEVNRLFEQRTGNRAVPATQRRENVSARVWTPAVDVIEDEHEIIVSVDLPGVKQEDIKIELNGDSLVVSGTRALPEESQREKYVRVERQYGEFQRSFTIGVQLQQDNVSAHYENGVLEVHLPKAEEVKPKRVEVKVGS